jgi:hypothetical protein
MFVCEICNRVSEAGESATKVVVATRAVDYPFRERIYWRPPEPGQRGHWDPDPGGNGRETVRELTACTACAAAKRG